MTYPVTYIPCSTVKHALRTLLWCSSVVDPANPDGDLIDCEDLAPSPQLIRYLTSEWEDFERQLESLGFDPEHAYTETLHPDNEGEYWNQVAHDWILTRQHHGAGFWDGAYSEPWATKLTDLAQSRPEFDLYLSDDDLVCCA